MTPSPLALSIARHLRDRWEIGEHIHPGFSLDWVGAGEDEVATAIDTILLPRLAAHADAIEDALDASVNTSTYPDGPNLPRETRGALRTALADLKPSSP